MERLRESGCSSSVDRRYLSAQPDERLRVPRQLLELILAQLLVDCLHLLHPFCVLGQLRVVTEQLVKRSGDSSCRDDLLEPCDRRRCAATAALLLPALGAVQLQKELHHEAAGVGDYGLALK